MNNDLPIWILEPAVIEKRELSAKKFFEGVQKPEVLTEFTEVDDIKEQLKGVLELPYDRPCMHECVFSDKFQQAEKVTTLDIAKRLIDYGFHPPTIYFPLVVHGTIMIYSPLQK